MKIALHLIFALKKMRYFFVIVVVVVITTVTTTPAAMAIIVASIESPINVLTFKTELLLSGQFHYYLQKRKEKRAQRNWINCNKWFQIISIKIHSHWISDRVNRFKFTLSHFHFILFHASLSIRLLCGLVKGFLIYLSVEQYIHYTAWGACVKMMTSISPSANNDTKKNNINSNWKRYSDMIVIGLLLVFCLWFYVNAQLHHSNIQCKMNCRKKNWQNIGIIIISFMNR